MSENITKFCEICQIKLEEEGTFHLLDNDCKLKLLDLLPEIDLHLTQNSVICDQCFTQITNPQQEFKQLQIKDEDNKFNELDANFKEIVVNNDTICVKEEPGVEKIKEEFNVGLFNDKVRKLKVDFLVYIDKKNSTEMYYCCACGCCTDTKQKLTEHIHKQHRKKDLMRKPICQKRILSQLSGKKPYWCDKCDFKTPRKDSLKKHKLTHTNVKLYRCIQCKYACNAIPSLKRHMVKHNGEYPFQCNECGYKSVLKAHLNRHMLSQHIDEKPYQCDKCDYKTGGRENLKVHEFSHTGEYPFQCDECDYKCAYKVSLEVHKCSHTNEKPYKCTQCDYGCSVVTDLNNHMGTHTGEYPFQCDKCDYKCVYKSFLNRHRLSQHPGEKKHHCDKCDYKSVRKSSLKKHKIIHTYEKPFKCTHCNFSSKQLKRFKRHMCQHTSEKPCAISKSV